MAGLASSTLPTDVLGLEHVTAIAAGGANACAIADGSVWCWGKNDYGQLGDGTTNEPLVPVSVSVLPSTATQIAVGGAPIGYGFACAALAEGTMCWGRNGSGQLGAPPNNLANAPTLYVTGLH